MFLCTVTVTKPERHAPRICTTCQLFRLEPDAKYKLFPQRTFCSLETSRWRISDNKTRTNQLPTSENKPTTIILTSVAGYIYTAIRLWYEALRHKAVWFDQKERKTFLSVSVSTLLSKQGQLGWRMTCTLARIPREGESTTGIRTQTNKNTDRLAKNWNDSALESPFSLSSPTQCSIWGDF